MGEKVRAGVAAAVLLSVLAIGGCDRDSGERAGRKIGEAGEHVGEAVENVGEAVQEAVDPPRK